jgi:hypothetical protein
MSEQSGILKTTNSGSFSLVGKTIRLGRTDYLILASIFNNGEHIYLGRKETSYGYSYKVISSKSDDDDNIKYYLRS